MLNTFPSHRKHFIFRLICKVFPGGGRYVYEYEHRLHLPVLENV